jgi:maltose/moltooligosaccharide transporter
MIVRLSGSVPVRETHIMEKPRQSIAGLISISFGFLGIQFAFGLQNANVSRIFQSLGSSVDALPFLWLAGPVTGLLVQPLIGHFSDSHWGRFGRRRPFFFIGAVLAALALFGFPHAGSLFVGAVCLWLLDASLNISMEPFRAFVGDMTRADQRAAGYAVQTVLIGTGAVLGSLAPAAFSAIGVANIAPDGNIPDSVRYALYLGGVAIFLAVLWTVVRVKEFSPQEMSAFNASDVASANEERTLIIPKKGVLWLIVGVAVVLLVSLYALDKQLYVVGGALAGFGLLQIANQFNAAGNAARQILSDLVQMPYAMRRLAIVQFFSWIALFIMWIFTTPVVTQYAFGSTDTASKAYNAGAEWVGVMFAVYNGVSALAAFALPSLVKRIGAPGTHALCLLIGAFSYASMLLLRDANALILPMIGIGIAWSSILTMPYVMLADVLPQNKLGIYMGIFNFFVVLPQLLIATIMGAIIRLFFPEAPIWTMLCAAVAMGVASVAMFLFRKRI